MDTFGFSPAAFALSLDQRPNVAVGTNQGPALEMTPEVIPRTIPAVAGRHGSRSDFSINSYEAQSVPYHVTGLLCLHCGHRLSCPSLVLLSEQLSVGDYGPAASLQRTWRSHLCISADPATAC